MKLFIAPNSAVTFDSAMGYKNNPQLVQNHAADFLLPQICPNWYDYSLFFLNLAHEINHKLSHYEKSFYSLFRIAL